MGWMLISFIAGAWASGTAFALHEIAETCRHLRRPVDWPRALLVALGWPIFLTFDALGLFQGDD